MAFYANESFFSDGETRVNPFVGQRQNMYNEHAVAGLADGGYVITWQESGAIRGQVYDRHGARTGAEFKIDLSASPYGGFTPAVTALRSGGFAVAWTETDGDLQGSYAQIFSASGASVGGRIQLNTETKAGQAHPSIAGLASGGFVATWTDGSQTGADDSADAVKAQLFDATGAKVGGEFLVNSTTRFLQFAPDVVGLLNGGFVIAWIDKGFTSDFNIRAQIYDAAGMRVGGEVVVNSGRTGSQLSPVIAPLASGGFVIAWTNDLRGAGGGIDIRAQIFGENGGKVGADFLVHTDAAADQVMPALAGLPSGGFIVTWHEAPTYNDTFQGEIKAQLFDGVGGRIGGEFIVNSVTAGGQYAPAVAAFGSGDFVITWQEVDGRGFNPISAREFLSATSGTAMPDRLEGTLDRDVLQGGAGDDQLFLQLGGEDTALGGAGNDILFYGSALNAADRNDGGEGTDTLVLQGSYDLTLGTNSLVGIEGISIQSGSITRWGQSGTNSYDYKLTIVEANVAPGQQFRVNAQSLTKGEDFTFNGSAESDGGRFLVYGGHGVDVLTGGSGNDVFFFEAGRLGAGDKVNGGAGADAVVISGSDPQVSGPLTFEIASGTFSSIEALSFNGRFASDPNATPSYKVTLKDGNIAAGASLVVNGSSLGAMQTLSFDASAEATGRLRLLGGAGADALTGGANADLLYAAGGADTLRGGGGADTFQYRATSDSTLAGSDTILDFQASLDKIDLSLIDANSGLDGDQAFAFIGNAAFGRVAGQLRAEFDPFENRWIVQGDIDGDGAADIQILLTTTGQQRIGAGDFLL